MFHSEVALSVALLPLTLSILCNTDNACRMSVLDGRFYCNMTALVNCTHSKGCISYFTRSVEESDVWIRNFRGCASDEVISAVFDHAETWSMRCGFASDLLADPPNATVNVFTPTPVEPEEVDATNVTETTETTTITTTTVSFDVPGMRMVDDGAIELDDDSEESSNPNSFFAVRPARAAGFGDTSVDTITHTGCLCYQDECNGDSFVSEIQAFMRSQLSARSLP